MSRLLPFPAGETEAAYAIDLTQSAVSHALSALESELGVTLLERNHTGVVALTSVGQKLLPRVRALLAQAETIQQEARAARGWPGANSGWAVFPHRSTAAGRGVLTHFQQQYPTSTWCSLKAHSKRFRNGLAPA